MSVDLHITLKGVKIDLTKATRAELIEYFEALPKNQVYNWLYLLSGYAVGSARRIDELERKLKEKSNEGS